MLALGRTHTQMQSLILASFFSPIPDTRIRSSTEAKAPFLRPFIDNRLGHGGTDARERLQLCRACRIDVY